MPWNSTAPIGSISVKNNRPILQQNFTYIEDTMGNKIVGTNANETTDHFWNVDGGLDGHHRFLKFPKFTVGGNAADPDFITPIDSVLYVKQASTDLTRIQGFFRNSEGVFQFIPAYEANIHVVTATFTDMFAVPANCWGEIFMWTTASGKRTSAVGFFRSDAAICDAWSYALRIQGGSTPAFSLIFGNGPDASGLNIRVKTEDASSGLTWNYRILFRAI